MTSQHGKKFKGFECLTKVLSINEKHFSKFPLSAVLFFAAHDWFFNWQTKGVGGAAWEECGRDLEQLLTLFH